MAEFTENYGLEKPDQNEFYDVDVQNQNMEKIDQAIAEAGNNPQLEIDVVEIKDKIGAPNDAGNSSTTGTAISIFAKLNYLVSQVSSYLSNIYSRIGSQSDTASSATSASSHGKLNWFLNLFGKTDDTGGTATTGTVMGKLNSILNFSAIKSIQHVTGRQIANQSSNIHPISSVNLSKSIILFEVLWNTRGNTINYSFSETDITVTYVATGDYGSFGYDAWIVEFN